MKAHIPTRRPVWLALSTMFLSADVSLTRDARTRVLAASPYGLGELETILIEEVYPVCWGNLNAPDGERVGFDAQWLEASILVRLATGAAQPLVELARIAVPHSDEWQATCAALQALRSTATGS